MDKPTFSCECEHVDHFDDDHHCHDYGEETDTRFLHKVKTEFGTFAVCSTCALVHLKDHAITTEKGYTP